MGTVEILDKTSVARAKLKRFREEFRAKFGHGYDPAGFHGHPFFGYNCRDCGVHISLVRPERWLKAEHDGNFPGRRLPEFAGLKAGK